MDTCGIMKVHRGYETFLPSLETHPPQSLILEPVRLELLPEANSRVTLLQFNQLLQQV